MPSPGGRAGRSAKIEFMSIRHRSLRSNAFTATGACLVSIGAFHLVSICKREQTHSRDVTAAFAAFSKLETDAPTDVPTAPIPRNGLIVQSIASGPEYFVGPEATGWSIIGGLLLFGTGLRSPVRPSVPKLRDSKVEPGGGDGETPRY